MTDTEATDTSRPPRPEKVAIVDEVRARLEGSSAALLTEYRGLKVSELATLRTTLTAAGGDLKIYKNTLVRFAVRDLGIEIDEAMLVGPTAIAFVDGDAAAVAKVLRDYARANPNLVVKGGVLGSSALSAAEARGLADLPSREVLLARLAGGLAAPLAGFAGLLQALPRNLAYGLKALIEKGGAPGAPTAGAAEAPPADAAAADAPAADAPAADAPAADAPAGDDILADAPAEGAPAAPVGDVPADVGASDSAPVADAPAADDILADAPAEGAPAPDAALAAPSPTTDAAPAAEAETTDAAPAAEADTEGEAAPAETTDTPEEAS